MVFLAISSANGTVPEKEGTDPQQETAGEIAGEKPTTEPPYGLTPSSKPFADYPVKKEALDYASPVEYNPGVSKNGDISTDAAPRLSMANGAPQSGQLTIFYSGTVNVYDGVSPEKAHALMLIAAAAATHTNNVKNSSIGPISTPVLARSSSFQCSSSAASQQMQMLPSASTSIGKLQADLPIARRHSLVRFLEKRRDRLGSKSPYASTVTEDKKGSTITSGKLGCSDKHTALDEAPPSVVAKLA